MTLPSALYRRVWRWHFYAGLLCLPFLVLMAITGALYLYQAPIESWVYQRLQQAHSGSTAKLDAETLLAQARTVVPGDAVRYVAPPASGRSAEVGIRTPDGIVAVYLDPANGEVLGTLRDDRRLMEVIKGLHSLQIVGTIANHGIEIVAGWSIVLVVSGIFLWWPRPGGASVYAVRGRLGQRRWWRDVHAVTGITAAAAVVFLAVTGMPWSPFWGQQYGQWLNERGLGIPQYRWARPASIPPPEALGDLPWTQSRLALPASDPHAGHHAPSPGGADTANTSATPSIGLNEALRRFASLGLPAGAVLGLPVGPHGVYTAMVFPDDVREQRSVHLDRYSGEVLADVRYADYGLGGRLTEWGISLHTGRQFGTLNRLVMLAGCLAIVLLAVSAVVMWWKRRPPGRLAAPPRRSSDRAAIGAVVVAAGLGLFYPLLGASMLAALLIDALVPSRWHDRFGL